MINQTVTSLVTTLFARKGEAMPSPAIGYVSITQLESGGDGQRAPAPPCRAGGAEFEPTVDDDERPLSSLIHRHRVRPTSTTLSIPANDSTTAAWERSERQGTTIDIMRYFSVASRRDNDDAGDDENVETPRFRLSHRLRRKQLTLRLGYDVFRELQNLSYVSNATYQSLLEAAVINYLETLDTEHAAEAG